MTNQPNGQTVAKKPPRIEIPSYSLGEELFHAISHGVGALLGVAALVLMIVAGAPAKNAMAVVTGSIFGGTLILLYTMSCLYHALKVNKAKRVFRVIDHCTIYLLIAGTYTPYTLLVMGAVAGWVLFGVVWAGAVLGIVFTAIAIRKYKVLSMVAYLAMGWAVVFTIDPLIRSMAAAGLWLLLIGGILYTLGAVLYGLGKKFRYMHAVFHFFVLLGSLMHFFSLYFYGFLPLI